MVMTYYVTEIVVEDLSIAFILHGPSTSYCELHTHCAVKKSEELGRNRSLELLAYIRMTMYTSHSIAIIRWYHCPNFSYQM